MTFGLLLLGTCGFCRKLIRLVISLFCLGLPCAVLSSQTFEGFRETKTISAGSGAIFPFKFADVYSNDSFYYAIQGSGETSPGEAHLYALDRYDLSFQKKLALDANNLNDVCRLNDEKMVLSSRGSSKLIFIDIYEWKILSSLKLDFQPSAIVCDNNVLYVSSVNSTGELVALGVENINEPQTLAITKLDGFIRHIVKAENSVYAIQSNRVVEFDSESLLEKARFLTNQSSLSFNSIFHDGELFVPDRDGFVHILDITSGAVSTISINDLLGIDDATAALRSTDTVSVYHLIDDSFLVVNNRKESVIVKYNSKKKTFRLQRTTFSGFNALFDESTETLLFPTAKSHKIKIDRDIFSRKHSNETIVSGVTIKSGILSNENNALLITQTDRTARIYNYTLSRVMCTFVLPGGYDLNVHSGTNGDFVFFEKAVTGESQSQLHAYGRDCQKTESVSIPLVNPYSTTFKDERLIITDRIFAEILTLNNQYELESKFTLLNSRPRRAISVDDDTILVIHDTVPDIGVSKLTLSSSTMEYAPLTAGKWWSDIGKNAEGSIKAITFAGSVADISTNLSIENEVRSDFLGALKFTALGLSMKKNLVISESLGKVMAIDSSTNDVIQEISSPGVIDILSGGENGFMTLGTSFISKTIDTGLIPIFNTLEDESQIEKTIQWNKTALTQNYDLRILDIDRNQTLRFAVHAGSNCVDDQCELYLSDYISEPSNFKVWLKPSHLDSDHWSKGYSVEGQ